MGGNNQTYKSIFLVIILILGVATLYGIKTDEAPRFILFLGRFHPLLLHLPIGALVVTFFIDVLGRIQKNYPENTIKYLLGFISIAAVITCFLGFFLSLEGGYQEDTLDLHFYTGIATAALVTILFFISTKPSFTSNKVFLPLFTVTLICISVAGHFGSVLTHGDNFLTEYISVPEKEKTIDVVDSLKLYDNVVAKILDQKCIQCHNTSKKKGDLTLGSKDLFLKGGKSGLSVISGNALESLLYTRLLLPISNEKHMPPEGKEQLTKDEIWLIEHWINNGLDFENYATTTSKNDTLKTKLKKYLVFNKAIIPKASLNAIEGVRDAGFRVIELVPGEAELNVKYLGKVPKKETLDELSALKEQIVELDFNDSELTDEMIYVLKELKNLKSLRLNSTLITDKAIESLKGLKNLEVLNIYNTKITNKGLTELLKVIQPKRIYSWNTKINQETATTLAKAYKINIQNTIISGFVENSQLELPLISTKKTLFLDTIHVNALSRLKDVQLRYTLDGHIPDSTSKIFKEKLVLNTSKTFKISAFKKGWEPSDVLTQNYTKIKHKISNFKVINQPDERYPDANKLFDLKEGSLDFKDGNWIGYFGSDANVTIDLGDTKAVNNISISCLEDIKSWILYPTDFIVYASKTKNGSFKKIGHAKISRERKSGESEMKKVTLSVTDVEVRYLKLLIRNHKSLPEWHESAGNPSWLFVDEIYFW